MQNWEKPKFQIGDVVEVKGTQVRFRIKGIGLWLGQEPVYYPDRASMGWIEQELQLINKKPKERVLSWLNFWR